jgi:polysaccharide export outer membrane protein
MTVMTRSAVALLMLASGSVPAGLWPAPAAAQERSYVLGPDDVIDVQVYGEFPQPVRLRIRPDGTISLPLIGNIRAADQTPGQLAETLRQLYLNGGYYNSPVVNVEVVSYTSRSATVLGAVRTPGVVPLIRPTTLTNVIATAGGQLAGAQTAILRRPGAAEQKFVIAEVAGTPADPVLLPGDVVVVPQAERFFVYGQVRTPGAFPLEPGMTMRQALAQAGGQNDSGTERSIRLHRGNRRSDVQDLDQAIRPGDVLFIRERIF